MLDQAGQRLDLQVLDVARAKGMYACCPAPPGAGQRLAPAPGQPGCSVAAMSPAWMGATQSRRRHRQHVDVLSNWYVRRSRRFWAGDPGALATLHECLRLVTLVSAPLTPFITERVWQDLFAVTGGESSVHLASWPAVDDALVDEDLDARMQLARRIVELGRAARADAKVRTRQPLRRALVPRAPGARLGEDLRGEVAEELNIGAVEALDSAGDLVDFSAKGNFRALGKRFAKRTPEVAGAIAAADAAALAAQLRERGSRR